MKIPLTYIVRNLFTRRLTTSLTILGIALVVFVFAAVLMLSNGLRQTLVSTGNEDNVLILRKGANTELVSGVTRDLINLIKTIPHIATDEDGKPILSTEVVTIINLRKFETHDMGNVTVRGVLSSVMRLRPNVILTKGRMFADGSREVIIGSSIHKRFEGANLGDDLKFGGDLWRIVGVFESNGNGFESEIWGDVEQVLSAFNRPGAFSSVTVKLRDTGDYQALKESMDADQRFQQLTTEREREYYDRQSEVMSIFIKVLGLVVTIIFSFGAIIGAMITMYASVANRTNEIGTLRALGFKRRSVMAAFLIESLVLSLIGGAAGLLLAMGLQFVSISTTNFGTFAEIAFSFAVSLDIVINSFIFAIIMGFVGGFLPAARAARLNIISALRSP